MKRYSIIAAVCALSVALTMLVFASPDVLALAYHPLSTSPAWGDMLSHSAPYSAAASVVALRLELDGLVTRAAAKVAEITDDISPDAARSIQDEHALLLRQIEDKRAEIAKAEAEELANSQRSNAPDDTSSLAARSADILDLGTRAGMSVDVIQTAIREGVALDVFRTRAFDHLAQRSNENQTAPGRVLRDEVDTRREAQIEALSYRIGAPVPAAGPSAAARGHMGNGILAVAAECVGHRGMIRNAREAEDILTRAAHTTSDFPLILEGSINRTLEGRYALAQPTYRSIARRQDFRDFRPHSTVKVGDFPMLKPVLEDGEIKFGSLTEGKEQISVLSYARAISVSRQLMINDDLGAIANALSDYGTMVALFEEIIFYSQAFNGRLADGKTVFHVDHGNLAAAGAAISVESVAAGRKAMSTQKSMDGNPLLINRPSTLLTGPETITAAEMLVASITPATISTVNIFSGKLDPKETAQITGNDWYLLNNPDAGSNWRWGYLEGYEAPRVRIENPFGRQGMAMSVEHDFGAGATDFRYAFKNPGQ